MLRIYYTTAAHVHQLFVLVTSRVMLFTAVYYTPVYEALRIIRKYHTNVPSTAVFTTAVD